MLDNRVSSRMTQIGICLTLVLAIGGCDRSSSEPTMSEGTKLALQVTEFGPVADTVHLTGNSGPYKYTVSETPTRGSLSIDSETGNFEYFPSTYASGTDRFVVNIRGRRGNVTLREVSISNIAGLETRPTNPSCIAPERPITRSTARAVRVFAGIGEWDMVSIYQPPASPDTWWGIVRPGQIIRFDNRDDVSTSSMALDLSARVVSDGELGLLGLAFHPSFQQNGKVYLYWTGVGSPAISYLSEFTSYDGGLTLDPASERVLLSLSLTTAIHNGGDMEFGPDGYLYLGLGEDGVVDHAQDTSNLFGTMIRIDPEGGVPYGIPPDNPFATSGGMPEIYAWGLRNPWRWSFDSTTGDLWLGDVGAASWEEINIVQKGGNYGWPIREGSNCYPPSVGTCNTSGLIDPVFEYAHTDGFFNIIGGHVYHGDLLPDLRGSYIFADGAQRLVYVLESNSEGRYERRLIADMSSSGRGIWGISTDLEGEIYIVKPDGIFRLELAPQAPDPVNFPERLSDTGCFDPEDPTQAVSGMIPYDINQQFWSNGAFKRRWMALPDGETIRIGPDGDWEFPVGSVLAKQFYFDDAPVETRLLVRHNDGGWAGYAYKWRADLSDADLVDGAVSLMDQGLSHTIPSRGHCLQCHVDAAGDSLGPENAQVNMFVDYPSTGMRANQLITLQAIGLFEAPLPDDPINIARLPALDDTSVELVTRAKAYLHVNCSNCHRPGGPGRGTADFRFEVPHSEMGVCNMPALDDFGNPLVALIFPGDPSLSAVNIRASLLGVGAMPPLGKQAVDDAGIALLDEYVSDLASCP